MNLSTPVYSHTRVSRFSYPPNYTGMNIVHTVRLYEMCRQAHRLVDMEYNTGMNTQIHMNTQYIISTKCVGRLTALWIQ